MTSRARNRKAESVECPCCGADVGHNCQRVDGKEPGRSCPTHQSRVKLARVAVLGRSSEFMPEEPDAEEPS